MYRILDWDSDKFGYKVVQIDKFSDLSNLQSILNSLRDASVKLAYVFVNTNDIYKNECALSSGSVLVDTKVMYTKSLQSIEIENSNDINISIYSNVTINDQILHLALESGEFSRFRTDPHFKNCEFENMYTEWISRSVSGDISFRVLIYKNIEQQILGFATLQREKNIGRIGLFAVGKQHRRQGIGKKLIQRVFTDFRDMNITEVRVATQKNNIAACNFYTKQGFDILSEQNIYHFWL